MPHHTKAMQMRLQGCSYEEIGKAIGKSPVTVASWFYESDTMRETFARMKQECIDRARNKLADAAADAADKIIDMKNMKRGQGSQIALLAAKDILDRVGCTAPKQSEVKLTGNMKNTHTLDDKMLENPEAVELLKQLFDKIGDTNADE